MCAATSFSAHLDRPLEECLAALERWASAAGRRPPVRIGPDAGVPPVRYRVALNTAPWRRTPLDVRVGPWAGAASTHLELVPARRVRQTRRYLSLVRLFFDELTVAAQAADRQDANGHERGTATPSRLARRERGPGKTGSARAESEVVVRVNAQAVQP